MKFSHISDELCVNVECCQIGPLETNVYLLSDGESVIIVDPAGAPDAIIEAAEQSGRKIGAIVLTHGHSDHTGAAAEIKQRCGVDVYGFEVEVPVIQGDTMPANSWPRLIPCEVDRALADGDTLSVGKMKWRVIHTPGHSKGSMCLFGDTDVRGDVLTRQVKRHPILIAGDTLFYGSVGRMDLPGGSITDMRNSIHRLLELPDDTVVLTGHGPLTSIGLERGRVFDILGGE